VKKIRIYVEDMEEIMVIWFLYALQPFFLHIHTWVIFVNLAHTYPSHVMFCFIHIKYVLHILHTEKKLSFYNSVSMNADLSPTSSNNISTSGRWRSKLDMHFNFLKRLLITMWKKTLCHHLCFIKQCFLHRKYWMWK